MKQEKKRNIAAGLVLAAALALIILGVMKGQANDVFFKAINICLECVGIG